MEDVEILQVNTQPGVQSVANLRKEIKALRDQLLGLQQGTKEYNDTLLELGDKTHQLREMQEQVKQTTTDFGDRLANVRGTITGLTGAFQTVLGSLSLMGVELGDDVKMLKMLQSAMAITQGVAAIDSGVKAFRALTISIKASTMAMSGMRRALIATGIGAAAVAVGVLVSKLMELKEKQDAAAEAAKKHAEQLKKVGEQIKAIPAEASQAVDAQRQAANMTARAIELAAQNSLVLAEQARLQHQVALTGYADDVRKFSAEGQRVWREYFDVLDALASKGDDAAKADAYRQRLEYDLKLAEFVKKQAEAAAKAVKDAESASPTENKMQGVDNAPSRDYAGEAQQAELQALTDYTQRKADIMINGEADVQEQLLQLDMEYRDRREELLRQRFENGLITEQDFNNQLAQLELEAADLQLENEAMLTDQLAEQEAERTRKKQEEIEKRKALEKGFVAAMSASATAISTVLGAISDTMEEGTQEWKALKIVQATIDTIQGGIAGFMSGVNSGLPAPYNLILAAATAATVIATGIANIAKLKNVQVSKSGGSGNVGSVSTQAVSVNATTVTPTRAVQTDEDIANLPDTRVYVLEEDITNAQKRVEVSTDNATY